MGEFGHFAGSHNGSHIDAWGAGPFKIVVDGAAYLFEDSDRFGPVLLTKLGEPTCNQPPERHPFWAGYVPWRSQGRRTEADDMTCAWSPLKPTKAVLLGRVVQIVEEGDAECDEIVIVGEDGEPTGQVLRMSPE